MRARADFAETVRRGRRLGSPLLVVHVDRARPGAESASGDSPHSSPDTPTRVGFVVSRGVGGAVVRNRLRRRLRHLVRDRLAQLPSRSMIVVRATPAAATATTPDLAATLDRLLGRAIDRGSS
jgi:ribonuclease P protein component